MWHSKINNKEMIGTERVGKKDRWTHDQLAVGSLTQKLANLQLDHWFKKFANESHN